MGGKAGRALVALGTGGISEGVRAVKGVKKALVDDPAAAREEALSIQREQVAAAEARAAELAQAEQDAAVVTEQSQKMRSERSRMRASGRGRASTILTQGVNRRTATTESMSSLGASSVLGG